MAKVNKEKFKVYEGVFDEFTLDILEELRRKKYIDSINNPIKTGKEGDVYFAKKEDELRAIKIYRITSANFRKISEYITRDFRFKNIKGNMRKVILAWVEKEFRNLNLCYKKGMNVPKPFKQKGNVIIMEYIEGDMLKNTALSNPARFLEILLDQLKIMINDANLIHGDLSEFNILVKDDIPFIIDMGQSMSIKNYSDFKAYYDLFERDIKNIVNYFNKMYNLNISLEKIIKDLEPKSVLEED